MKLMLRHVRVGVMLTIHVHLHHEVDATSRQGWGDVNLPVHLHHEVDARHVRVGCGVFGVMLTFLCTCIMKLMLRGCGVFGVILTFLCTCIMKLMLRHVWVGCGVFGVMLRIHVHLHHEVDATSRQGWGDVNDSCALAL